MQTAKATKHDTYYAKEIFTVVKRKESLIVARSTNKTITRHVNFFKKVLKSNTEKNTREENAKKDQTIDQEVDRYQNRISREKKRPARYRDNNYVYE